MLEFGKFCNGCLRTDGTHEDDCVWGIGERNAKRKREQEEGAQARQRMIKDRQDAGEYDVLTYTKEYKELLRGLIMNIPEDAAYRPWKDTLNLEREPDAMLGWCKAWANDPNKSFITSHTNEHVVGK
ncbi:MAG: hypothetical protein SGPRY_007717, partial [Prymnesium sp.]